jgi:hypothetical protein
MKNINEASDIVADWNPVLTIRMRTGGGRNILKINTRGKAVEDE